ncbi:predicted protein [Uncinocarpus reesii 1704]|uniref:Enoyl reductase (ER) domain-containing protein n=1 Tax=Uncinocarpus reesii (strain UAMH 1704) TaxID=336963 RepID=C4JGD0_UNCRE|nr:uncharacterized protein UREG_01121 [Uncinocarpus reesii 1704]EEP76272.1 predicted protein [Uncinocarpus reesii 1704]
MASPIPKLMRALIQPNAAETRLILTQCEVPVPDKRAGEHLIRVHSIAPCAGELLWPKNFPPPKPRELIPCYDIAGTVVAAPESSPFRVGNEVYARTNYFRPGCARDYAIGVVDELAHRPQHLSWVQAAAIPLSSQTAWQALFVRSGVGGFTSGAWKGKRVLVTAASGGVGIWVTQLAKLAGATVIGTCGPENVELVHSLGAVEVINYRTTNLREWAQAPEKKVDVVIDCIGRKSLEDAWWAVKTGGILLSIFQPPEQVKPEEYTGTGVNSIFFVMSPNRAHLEEITKLVDEGKCRSVVDSVWPLEQFEEAFKRLDSGHAKGKIIFDLSLNN